MSELDVANVVFCYVFLPLALTLMFLKGTGPL